MLLLERPVYLAGRLVKFNPSTVESIDVVPTGHIQGTWEVQVRGGGWAESHVFNGKADAEQWAGEMRKWVASYAMMKALARKADEV